MNTVRRSKHFRKIFNNSCLLGNSRDKISCGSNTILRRNFFQSSVLCNLNHEFVLKSPLSAPVIPETGFLERLWRDSAGFKTRVAIECSETGKNYTYEQLWDNSARFATSLRSRFGLQSQDVVAIMLPNCVEYPAALLGSLQAGCSVTTVNPIYKEFEITHQFGLTKPKVVITINECYNTVTKALEKINCTAKIVIVDKPDVTIPEGSTRFSEVAESGPIDLSMLNKIEMKDSDIAFIPFSSGTTGLPKGVELTKYNIMASLDMMQNERVSLAEMATADFQDVVPCVLPFFHIYGLIVIMMAHFSFGCKLVTMQKFSPNTFLNVLKDYKASVLYVVPPIALFLSKHPDVKEEHLASLRNMLCGAAPISASDIMPLVDKTKGKLSIRQGYGATETTSIASISLITSHMDYSSAGVPIGGMEFIFIDPSTGKQVPIGQEGELLVKGPNVMKGYYKNEKATKDSITADGFYKTGDLAYYKPDVGIFITDRIKELIKVKGMQVAPAELESLLRSHPAVQDAAVIGIPHEIYGEVPKAFIITKNGKNTSEEELQDFVAKQVAVFKKIEEVQFVKDIPKTASGKILRRELKQMYA